MAKRKSRHLEIGTTVGKTTVRRYQNYDLVDRIWADGQGGTVSTRDYQTKSGDQIVSQQRRGRKPGIVRMIDKHGIKPELANSNHSNCSVGRAADGTWYGWSHRAAVGFRPGRDHAFDKGRLKDDTPFQHSTVRLIKTDRGARGSAARFARYVS